MITITEAITLLRKRHMDPDNQAVIEVLESMQWRSIETAPRDGSAILAYDENLKHSPMGSVVKAHWYTHTSVSGWITPEMDCAEYDFSPTHWMPLPQPPRSE